MIAFNNFMHRVILKFNIRASGEVKKEFSKSLRELVAILFAIVIGLGFERIDDARCISDYIELFVAIVAVFMSWWGYNFGILYGPVENNAINYIIDCFLLIIYWFIINKSNYMILSFIAMFILYLLWEVVRFYAYYDDNMRMQPLKAIKVNSSYTFYFVLLYALRYIVDSSQEAITQHVANIKGAFTFLNYSIMPDKRTFFAIAVLLLCIMYRCKIKKAYACSCVAENNARLGDYSDIIEVAKGAYNNAYARLSKYRVGAAILAKSGNIYKGANVEFENYSNTIHAEESAISAMISGGDTVPIVLAVFTGSNNPAFPCGMCLQSLFELGGNNLIVVASNEHTFIVKNIKELLPYAFSIEG